MKRLLNFLSLFLLAAPVLAQEAAEEAAAPASSSPDLLMNIVISVFVIAAIVLLVVSLVLLKTFRILSKELLNPTPLPAMAQEKRLEFDEWKVVKKEQPGLLSKVLGLRPISEEKEIMLEHEFDGITELDNPTPAWFMWLFYASIAFGVVYFLSYHVFNWGKLQDEEYAIEMQEAEEAKKAYLAKAANLIDENTVTENLDAAVVSSGQAIYNSNCVACHGDKGQGTVGPNLTDEYWLHGGKVNDVFKTIKYGIPEKGMISWEKTLTPKQISEVSNYILSLKGTNPAGAKEPQGEKAG